MVQPLSYESSQSGIAFVPPIPQWPSLIDPDLTFESLRRVRNYFLEVAFLPEPRQEARTHRVPV